MSNNVEWRLANPANDDGCGRRYILRGRKIAYPGSLALGVMQTMGSVMSSAMLVPGLGRQLQQLRGKDNSKLAYVLVERGELDTLYLYVDHPDNWQDQDTERGLHAQILMLLMRDNWE